MNKAGLNSQKLIFKQWTRNGFAIFSTLSSEVVIGSLSIKIANLIAGIIIDLKHDRIVFVHLLSVLALKLKGVVFIVARKGLKVESHESDNLNRILTTACCAFVTQAVFLCNDDKKN